MSYHSSLLWETCFDTAESVLAKIVAKIVCNVLKEN